MSKMQSLMEQQKYMTSWLDVIFQEGNNYLNLKQIAIISKIYRKKVAYMKNLIQEIVEAKVKYENYGSQVIRLSFSSSRQSAAEFHPKVVKIIKLSCLYRKSVSMTPKIGWAQ